MMGRSMSVILAIFAIVCFVGAFSMEKLIFMIRNDTKKYKNNKTKIQWLIQTSYNQKLFLTALQK